MKYNWQRRDWPHFKYSIEGILPLSVAFAKELGLTNGLLWGLDENLKQETGLQLSVEEAVKTSEIEGEYLSREDVMSSIKNNLGLNEYIPVKDKRASGIAELMVQVHKTFGQPLTLVLICKWHHLLLKHEVKINAGSWRSGEEPKQIVSGAYGREVVHYEAPPSHVVPAEMEKFIQWYDAFELAGSDAISSALIKSSIVHLYFESIHPFEDGNGRIGRALVEFTLARTIDSPTHLSLSKVIEKQKKEYYQQLKSAQHTLTITPWLQYFSQVLVDAQREARESIEFTVKKSKFFNRYAHTLNDRQLKVITRMLENGAAGFEGGKMRSSQYVCYVHYLP